MDPAVAFAGTFHVADGVLHARGGVRRRVGRPGARDDPRRGLLPLADRPLDPRRCGLGAQHTLTYFGPAHAGLAVRRRTRRDQGHAVRAGDRRARRAPGRAARELRAHGRRRRPVHRGARSRRTSSTTWPCPAATSSTATWTGRGPPTAARLDTPAQQWGVQTDHAPVLLCGSGARRGGAVSGIGGHNAAQAVLAVALAPLPPSAARASCPCRCRAQLPSNGVPTNRSARNCIPAGKN